MNPTVNELAKKIISQNGVVYGAAYDGKFEVYHCCVDRNKYLYIFILGFWKKNQSLYFRHFFLLTLALCANKM